MAFRRSGFVRLTALCGGVLQLLTNKPVQSTRLRTGEAKLTEIKRCGAPKFDGNWTKIPDYPLNIGEAQGGIIGDDLVVTGGFYPGFASVSVQTYALQLSVSGSVWRRMDDFPISQGMTHAAFAIDGDRMFFCGGYQGAHPGPAVADCFVYNHSTTPGTSGQWSRLPSLPQSRAGGGLVYDASSKTIVFAGGAVRPKAGNAFAVDCSDTWTLSPGNPKQSAWSALSNIPHWGNHLSFVTTTDSSHHFFVGGQQGENEKTGNLEGLMEYVPAADMWIARTSMPFPRSHASSSTVPYGCGFLIAGGSINDDNQKSKTADVSYYGVYNDQWTNVGALKTALKTPVCGIYAEYLYCTTGYTRRGYRRKLISR